MMSEEEMAQKNQIINAYKMMRQQVQTLAGKISELDSDRNEHELVIRTIRDLDPKRRCFRSIGGVLVERTVAEVLPAVTKNLTGIEQVIKKLSDQLAMKERETEAFRVEHGIGGIGGGEERPVEREQKEMAGGAGVLV